VSKPPNRLRCHISPGPVSASLASLPSCPRASLRMTLSDHAGNDGLAPRLRSRVAGTAPATRRSILTSSLNPGAHSTECAPGRFRLSHFRTENRFPLFVKMLQRSRIYVIGRDRLAAGGRLGMRVAFAGVAQWQSAALQGRDGGSIPSARSVARWRNGDAMDGAPSYILVQVQAGPPITTRT
jgi:hypothetical protein